MIDSLGCADRNVKDTLFPDTPFLKSEILSANAGDKNQKKRARRNLQ